MDDQNRESSPAPSNVHSMLRSGWHRFAAAFGRRYTRYGLIGATALGALAVFFGWMILASMKTPDIDDIQHARTVRPSILLTADGRPLGVLRQSWQKWVSLDEISPEIPKALVATEDHRFYEHHGVDYARTAAAIVHTLGGDPEGGSTITQQLARNLFPEEIGRSRTVTRKLKEILTALKIERKYTKRQILETYLNTVPFLYNVTGIEMAARTYYGKSAAELNPTESAMLVGMLKGTYYYNPVVNPERALKRRNVVLAQMMRHGELSQREFERMSAQPLRLHFARQRDAQDESAAHFIVHVRKWLAEWSEKNHVDPYADGLVIETTLDSSLQQAAVDAVDRQTRALQNIADVEWSRREELPPSSNLASYAKMRRHAEPFRYFWNQNPGLLETAVRDTPEFRKALEKGVPAAQALSALEADAGFMAKVRAAKTRLEAGFVAIDPASGEVKAWVGSRDFTRDQFDHVAQAQRQPGSTFKPIVYGAALEQGFSPDRAYLDIPVAIRSRGELWRPTDISGFSGRSMSLRQGLVYSKNSITAQVMQDVGMPTVVDLARAVGIKQSRLDPVPSLALGTSPVTLLEMVSAYATIADTGEYSKPLFVRRITDRQGHVLAEFANPAVRAFSESTAVELIDMLRGAVDEGTGRAMHTRFGVAADIAGKTGTTQNNTDGWFILMHPNLVAGAWVGFNDARVTMRSDYWGQGGHNAILLVGDFFRDALKSKLIDASARFPQPIRMPPLEAQADQVQDWRGMLDSTDAIASVQPPAGAGVIVRQDGKRLYVGDRPEMQTVAGNVAHGEKTADDLAEALSGMGRDPVTGERIESSGGSAREQASGKD